MGRETKVFEKIFNKVKKNEKKIKVKLFPWEELNAIDALKKTFGLTNGAAKVVATKGKVTKLNGKKSVMA
jgi:hypothetical protein